MNEKAAPGGGGPTNGPLPPGIPDGFSGPIDRTAQFESVNGQTGENMRAEAPRPRKRDTDGGDPARSREFDLLGIGLGPFNLSTACLATSVPQMRTHFLEQRADNRWHPRVLFPESDLQVSFLKDLVSLVEPTNRFSFLNFLVHTGRIHRFASTPQVPVPRWEFARYYAWAAGQLANAEFSRGVTHVQFLSDSFHVHTEQGVYTARNLSVGAGLVPSIPACAKSHVGPRVLHSSDFLAARERMVGQHVAVVGGGQSGAEIFSHLLDRPPARRPASITWITRRNTFACMDDSAFTNEFFHPDYVRYFHQLAPERRHDLLSRQQLASDGISTALLQHIYRRLYENDFADPDPIRYRLLPGNALRDMSPQGTGWHLGLLHQDSGTRGGSIVDTVVLATGYEFALPDFLAPLADRLPDPSPLGLPLRDDYSVPWAGPDRNRIFFLNAGRHSHGIADPNLSLASWRAAHILNSLVGTAHFRTGGRTSTCEWPGLHTANETTAVDGAYLDVTVPAEGRRG
ncbi:lysine N6-hydroxylase [Murinocardiopsis flavida]|uniref:L-lysine N6-monooxygenase MbtG n=1 Tax=Murinocardiopsis flavida TaxID=645275 RepID=A0A2P8D170_9ACTN|nr:SidA/IucD/PvdA family monooxygenase [Murinocardiopsis flavida]PSK90964.1 lysine N6-hydroxylase [Murinocardiopsis flavida]